MRVTTCSPEETLQLGRNIGRSLTAPRTILLFGELGAGKTLLTRGVLEGLGVDTQENPVTSPTFTLVNEYPSPHGVLYHLDLYRLQTIRDLYSIGIEEILAAETIVIVEWADRLPLPVDHPLEIRIQARDNRRDFDLQPALPI